MLDWSHNAYHLSLWMFSLVRVCYLIETLCNAGLIQPFLKPSLTNKFIHVSPFLQKGIGSKKPHPCLKVSILVPLEEKVINFKDKLSDSLTYTFHQTLVQNWVSVIKCWNINLKRKTMLQSVKEKYNTKIWSMTQEKPPEGKTCQRESFFYFFMQKCFWQIIHSNSSFLFCIKLIAVNVFYRDLLEKHAQTGCCTKLTGIVHTLPTVRNWQNNTYCTDWYNTETVQTGTIHKLYDILLEICAQFLAAVWKLGKSCTKLVRQVVRILLYDMLLYKLFVFVAVSWDLCHDSSSKSVPTLFAQSSLSLYQLIMLSMISWWCPSQ